MYAPRTGGCPPGGVRLGSRRGTCRGACRRGHCDGDRRSRVLRGVRDPDRATWSPTGEPVLDRADASESRRGVGLDRARHTRPAGLGVHGLRRIEHGDRRRLRRDSARPRRRDVLRWHGSADHTGRAGRLRCDAGALGTKRRPGSCVTAVRCRTRRVRDRRGCGRARARGARARTGARRPYLRRADRVRHLLRRQSCLRSRSERP